MQARNGYAGCEACQMNLASAQERTARRMKQRAARLVIAARLHAYHEHLLQVARSGERADELLSRTEMQARSMARRAESRGKSR